MEYDRPDPAAIRHAAFRLSWPSAVPAALPSDRRALTGWPVALSVPSDDDVPFLPRVKLTGRPL